MASWRREALSIVWGPRVRFWELWPGIHQDTGTSVFSFWDNGISSSSTWCKAIINLQAFVITSQKPFCFGVVFLSARTFNIFKNDTQLI